MSNWEKRIWVLAALVLAGVLGRQAIHRLDTIEEKFDQAITIAKDTKTQIDAAKANSDTLVRHSDEAFGILKQSLDRWQLDERLRRWDAVAVEAHGVLTCSLMQFIARKGGKR